MNLPDRQAEWERACNPLLETGDLYCPHTGKSCRLQQCAHYDPKRDECCHVLAARAQVETAAKLAAVEAHLSAVARMAGLMSLKR